jgi:hypothetical protein
VRQSPDRDGDARQRAEADLVANRLAALHEEPLTGDFDLAHLRAVHAWLFQDLPHHQPGVIRGDTADGWIKRRSLEGETLVYAAPPLHGGSDRLTMLRTCLSMRRRSRTVSSPVASLVPSRDKKGVNADEGRCTLNTQMVRCGSQAVDHTFDFQTRLAEVK